jgi:hypothetical protein
MTFPAIDDSAQTRVPDERRQAKRAARRSGTKILAICDIVRIDDIDDTALARMQGAMHSRCGAVIWGGRAKKLAARFRPKSQRRNRID